MYNFKEVEKEINEFWKKTNLLKKLEAKNKTGENYFFLDGPPYANFIPHVGHLRTTVYKDIPIRLAYMKGKNVLFQPGFDTHGLPVENKVEKELKLNSKKDIEKLGVKKFMQQCKDHAAMNKDLWLKMYDNLGAWVARKEPYLTYDNSYVESGWWTFKVLHDKGLVYEGKKPVFWCPHCETALAGYEVTDSYKMLTDPAIYVKFKIKNKDEYLLAYTTTPWSLPAQFVLAVHSDEDYVKVKTSKGKLILAKERLELLTELEISYIIEKTFKGKDLEGLEYEPLLDIPQQQELAKNPKTHKVILSIPILKERVASKVAAKKSVGESKDVYEDFVNVVDGTGIVSTAPGHGKSDNEVGKYYKLPEPSPIDDRGCFTDLAGEFEGLFVKDADKKIIEKLKTTDRLLHHHPYTHKYPVCWRCKTPLIYRMSNQWFLKISNPLREKMLSYNENINWLPIYAKERMETWIANAEDWNISRQRYWGIPMPIWKCECGEIKVIDSVKALEKESGKHLVNFDIHTASEIKIKCKCSKKMERIKDIFDVWFDSGIAPWASLGYPFKNKELFESHFPVSQIAEAQDQIRGWFYHLIFCGTAVFDKIPLKEIDLIGWVLDAKGEKMSKSLGNVILAETAIKNYGSDAIRFYYMWDIAPYDTQKFNTLTLEKEIKKILNVLWNIKDYYLRLKGDGKVVHKPINLEDRWLLSKLNSLIKEYDRFINNFEYHNAARLIGDFILNTVSREYIQIVRDRAINKDENVIKGLYDCLLCVTKLLAPICPFISDKIYQEIKNNKTSVHLESFPSANKKLILKDIENEMVEILQMIELSLAEREKAKIGIRWPLKKVEITCKNSKNFEKFSNIIRSQVNIKEVLFKEGNLKIKLNTKITKDLEYEGFFREVTRKIQALRKKENLQPSDKINLNISSSYDLSDFKKEIKERCGVKTLSFNSKELNTKDIFKVKDKEFKISFEKL